jgi:hypothetical protein
MRRRRRGNTIPKATRRRRGGITIPKAHHAAEALLNPPEHACTVTLVTCWGEKGDPGVTYTVAAYDTQAEAMAAIEDGTAEATFTRSGNYSLWLGKLHFNTITIPYYP